MANGPSPDAAHAQPNGAQPPGPPWTARETIGTLIELVFIGLAVWLYASDHGVLGRAGWVLLYGLVSVISGLAFWLFTPGSTGEFSLQKYGVRLTGAAAIGASFAMLGWYLTKPVARTTVIPVPAGLPTQFILRNETPDTVSGVGEIRLVDGRRFLFVEFSDGKDVGKIAIEDVSGKVVRYDVELGGRAKPAADK